MTSRELEGMTQQPQDASLSTRFSWMKSRSLKASQKKKARQRITFTTEWAWSHPSNAWHNAVPAIELEPQIEHTTGTRHSCHCSVAVNPANPAGVWGGIADSDARLRCELLASGCMGRSSARRRVQPGRSVGVIPTHPIRQWIQTNGVGRETHANRSTRRANTTRL